VRTQPGDVSLPLSRDVDWPWEVVGGNRGVESSEGEALAVGDLQGTVAERVAARNSFTTSCHVSTST